MINFGYRAARMRGAFTKKAYEAVTPWMAGRKITKRDRIPVTVYSFSCERDLAEQIVSIRSFLSNMGTPTRFIVISDGSYTNSSRQQLQLLHPCVQVVDYSALVRNDLPATVYKCAMMLPIAKKLAVLMSLPIEETTIYTDSDVLFFSYSEELKRIIQSDQPYPYYMPDCVPSFDERLREATSQYKIPVNSGFLIFKKAIDWAPAVKHLEQMKGKPSYFIDQTITHLAMHYNGGLPLAKDQFILTVNDQFVYQEKIENQQVVLRHYVTPVRHKFWFNALAY